LELVQVLKTVVQEDQVVVPAVEVLIDPEELVTLRQYLPHKVNPEGKALQVHQETNKAVEVVVPAVEVKQLHLLLEEEMEELV
tara:strand:- start:234 stop:482 length:249 start_codon:yes stop_codon:yes gene_type:complete